MKLYNLLVVSAIGFFLMSCDPTLNINYEVVNETNYPITVNYINYYTHKNENDSNQTILILPPGKSQLIYSKHTVGTPEMAKEIDSIGIYFIQIIPDSILKGKNIRDIKNWEYYEKTENSVSFTLTIE